LKKIIISSGPLFATVGTKLENVSQITFKEAKRRWLYFSRLLKNEKKVNVLWWLNIQKNKLVPYESNPEISFLRAYFYRGIEEMGNVLLRLVNKYPNRGDYLKINVNELEKIMLEEGIDTSDIFNFRDTIKRIKLNRIYH